MNYALVLAAGHGQRFGSHEHPKQFVTLKGIPLFLHSVLLMEQSPVIDRIVIVTKEDYLDRVQTWIQEFHLTKVEKVTIGGSSRQESVFHGLESLKSVAAPADIVVIHDSARPLLSASLLEKAVAACQTYGAVSLAIPVSDTTVISQDGRQISDVPDRQRLYRLQTPQVFTFDLISRAHAQSIRQPQKRFTDDAQLVLQTGHPVYLIEGSAENIKVTVPSDLKIVEMLSDNI